MNHENDVVLWTDAGSNAGSNAEGITHRMGGNGFDFLNRSSNIQNINHHNQSIVSGSIMNTSGGYTTLNAKTRFKKPITGRAIKRNMFTRPEKSPGSRVSLTGRSINNSSIMTHYYTMKHNVAKL